MEKSLKQRAFTPSGAIICTAIWAFIVVLMAGFNLWDRPNTMRLNELGDFMAGAMSPLAIFWLVMVYVQQRKEMREQVKQTEIIAKETQKQVDIMDRQSKIQHEPLFVCLDPTIQSQAGGRTNVNIMIKNAGGMAMYLSIHSENYTIKVTPDTHVGHDESAKICINCDGSLDAEIVFVFGYQNKFYETTKFRCRYRKGSFAKEKFFSEKLDVSNKEVLDELQVIVAAKGKEGVN